LNYFSIGGLFALFPTPAVKTFGQEIGPRVYAMVLYASVAASAVVTIVVHTS